MDNLWFLVIPARFDLLTRRLFAPQFNIIRFGSGRLGFPEETAS